MSQRHGARGGWDAVYVPVRWSGINPTSAANAAVEIRTLIGRTTLQHGEDQWGLIAVTDAHQLSRADAEGVDDVEGMPEWNPDKESGFSG